MHVLVLAELTESARVYGKGRLDQEQTGGVLLPDVLFVRMPRFWRVLVELLHMSAEFCGGIFVRSLGKRRFSGLYMLTQ